VGAENLICPGYGHFDHENKIRCGCELGVTNTLALLRLLPMSDRAKDAEILALLECNEAPVRAADHLVVDGVEPPTLSVASVAKFDANVEGWARGAVKAVTASTGTAEMIKAVVLHFGKASTGRPVAALSGIVQKNAGDAWLGGGPLSTGAGGKALGNKVRIAMVGSAALFSTGLSALLP
jgi:hypothetical protein